MDPRKEGKPVIREPLFSVIIATYDRPRFLAEAIDSVLRQTIQDFEILVVDDASPYPAEVPDDPRVRLIQRQTNGGPAAAWNTALEAAVGRAVTFLGDDDWYTPQRLELAREGLTRAPITACWRDRRDGRTPNRRILDGPVADSILEGPTPSLGVTTIERSMAPRFDERFIATQDVEWWLRAASRGPVSTVRNVGYIQREHSAPRHGNDQRAHLDAGLLLLEVHADYFRSHPSSAAHRWLIVWQHAHRLGEYRIARRAAVESMRLRPHPRALKRLVRSLRSSPSDEASVARDVIGGTTG
jgi:glycosyltransferase involved in cell wall biosynthesis